MNFPIGSCYSVSHEKKRHNDRKRVLRIVKEEKRKDQLRPIKNIIYRMN